MTQTTAPTPAPPAMEAFVAKVATLSRLAADLTKLAIEVQTELSDVVNTAIDAAFQEETPDPVWVASTPLTPDDLDAKFPPGTGEHQHWYVVLRGRSPGLYPSYTDCDEQVRGVPNQFREKKRGRAEALAFYRASYERGEVEQWTEAE
ncbi:hypothetical protein C8J57DRAFT_1356672 [Mycena rebaudengoi]|nr:hypothetical protein C8J57DRAFT_1415809 [Mycena rebaudengoi]KAJ7199504.1 hypothetical protein C8J57DRAFT_1415712 [Mycena rebaudengoi]KAJ7237864.1 hypothetical protein C8J57DRAFT_1374902 [Mycena rebaudengoi]KAJ7249330.1 hypothetical protein C8J57DRAFT_1356672 [Mycena rebaudengoi]